MDKNVALLEEMFAQLQGEVRALRAALCAIIEETDPRWQMNRLDERIDVESEILGGIATTDRLIDLSRKGMRTVQKKITESLATRLAHESAPSGPAPTETGQPK